MFQRYEKLKTFDIQLILLLEMVKSELCLKSRGKT